MGCGTSKQEPAGEADKTLIVQKDVAGAKKPATMAVSKVDSGTLYLQIGGHDVSGFAAWKEMADGMKNAPADQKPPHMSLIKEFWLGPQKMPYSIRVVHVIEGKQKLEDVSNLFAPSSEFMKGFASNPVIKGNMIWNQFDVRIIFNPSATIEKDMVLGVYSHGVPDCEKWIEAFGAEEAAKMHTELGIVKSYAGVMVSTEGLGKCAWTPEKGIGVMVIHAFKTITDKHKFDLMFDPSTGMFKGMLEGGAITEPFYSEGIGPIDLFQGI
jgi:hypothetical protein